ncbi:hypothetical protein EVAR_97376_1 [Eumeta japonica]|uniref:Tf2-1-like SH3-like domain-containing protein n=1 Tax=Eumeta variegata TaxID=151549 RepID=A0A4C1YZ10_EUMVA|nr:hypothetical protein EVAR_97376_1 [Eumeta japonica]
MNISALHWGTDTVDALCRRFVRWPAYLGYKVLGITGTGLIDTAAKRSIAGSSLYALLVKRGQKFRSSKMIVKLADGSVNNINVKLADVIVTLNIPLTFIILPNSSNNETLLGIDFIRKAGLIINLSTNTWLTADRPHVIYPLRCETSVHTIECASTDVLRIDEGTMLSPPERDDLARLLQEYQDIFTQGGGPTTFAEHRIDTGYHPPIAVPPYRLIPYLLKLVDTLQNSKESAERQQDLRKSLKDKSRRDGTLIVGDLVLMKTHVPSSSIKGVTSKFVPKRDGPYLIHKKVSPTTYLLAYPETPDKPIGKYHISDLKRYHAREDACSNVPEPVIPKRRRVGELEKEGVNVGGSSSKSFSFINSESSITLLQVSPEQWKHTAKHFIPAFRHHIAPQFPLHLQKINLEAQGAGGLEFCTGINNFPHFSSPSLRDHYNYQATTGPDGRLGNYSFTEVTLQRSERAPCVGRAEARERPSTSKPNTELCELCTVVPYTYTLSERSAELHGWCRFVTSDRTLSHQTDILLERKVSQHSELTVCDHNGSKEGYKNVCKFRLFLRAKAYGKILHGVGSAFISTIQPTKRYRDVVSAASPTGQVRILNSANINNRS